MSACEGFSITKLPNNILAKIYVCVFALKAKTENKRNVLVWL